MFLIYSSYASMDKFSEPTNYSNRSQGKERRIKLGKKIDSRKKTKIAGKIDQKRT